MRRVLAAALLWAWLFSGQGMAEGASSDGRAPGAQEWETRVPGGAGHQASASGAGLPGETEEPPGERLFETVDGVTYYHGDPNFPVWSEGNRVGAVADLSSAYISDANERWRLVGFLSFPVVLRGKSGFRDVIPLEEEARECFVWQKVRDGSFFFNRDGRPFRKVEGSAFAREARVYPMIFEAAVANMGESFEMPGPEDDVRAPLQAAEIVAAAQGESEEPAPQEPGNVPSAEAQSPAAGETGREAAADTNRSGENRKGGSMVETTEAAPAEEARVEPSIQNGQ